MSTRPGRPLTGIHGGSVEWPTETDLAQECRRRGKGRQSDMGGAEEDLREPRPLEECCCGPMFPNESRGISQVSKSQEKERFLSYALLKYLDLLTIATFKYFCYRWNLQIGSYKSLYIHPRQLSKRG